LLSGTDRHMRFKDYKDRHVKIKHYYITVTSYVYYVVLIILNRM